MAGPAAAQEVKASGEAPAAVATEAIALFNRPETIRITGEFRVPAGSAVAGDVAVLRGPVTIAGRVQGRVVVINGNARLAAGARITGSLLVVGGTVSGRDAAEVAGTVAVYPVPLRVREEDGRLVAGALPRETALSAGYDFGFGRADMMLTVGRSYNRVEGLPVVFGPRLEFGGSNPTRLESRLIYRTESGIRFDSDEVGYDIRLEQFLGGRRALRLGAALRSEIVPIEDWGLADRENSLSTFLLHRDYRDHYEREGWAGYLRLAPPSQPYDLTFEYSEEEHRVVTAQGPWALFDNQEAWRPQPIIAEGLLRSVALRLGYDTRNDEASPSTGWLVRAALERGLGGTLAHPVTLNAEAGGPMVNDARPAHDRFTAALLDVRRYIRTGPASRLGLRVLGAGSVDGGALPPQRQHALGGEGSLPGYPLFAFDCGARAQGERGLFPYYGCDRLVLVQLEYEGELPFARGWMRRLGWNTGFNDALRWVIFFDAGRTWTEPDVREDRLRGQEDFAADAGIGLRLGHLGLYWAVPLSGRGQGVNFFVRIGPRL